MRLKTPIEIAICFFCKEWTVVEINTEDVARVNPEILGSSTPPDYEFCYIDISSVERGYINWDTVVTVMFANAPSRARRIVRSGDTIISTVRPVRNSHTFASWDDSTVYVCSTGFAVVRSKGRLVPQFLKHLPFIEPVTRQMVAWQCGTNYPAVNERDIRKLRVPVPPLEEQKAIAQILDAADTAIERTKEAIACARILQASLIADAIDRINGRKERLSEYITDVRYGTSQAANDKGWGNPTLRIPNVVGDEISFDDLVYVTAKPADVKRLKLQNGDLLLVRTNGNPNYVGRSALFSAPDQQDWIFASYLIRVRLNNQLLPEYVNIFLGTEQGRRELLRRVTTSAGNHNINANSIRLLQIPVPVDQSEQKNVIEIAKASRAYISGLFDKLAAQEQLKKALMHDLLTGKMRVNTADLASAV